MNHDPAERALFDANVLETVTLIRDTHVTNDELAQEVRRRFTTDELVHLTDMFDRLSEACFVVARDRERRQRDGLGPVPLSVVSFGQLGDVA